MSAPIRPFDLPFPPGTYSSVPLGLVEAPSPAIGRVLFATSSIDPSGIGVGEGMKKVGAVGRVAFASFIAILAAAFAGTPLALGVGALVSASLTYAEMKRIPDQLFFLPALIPALIALLLTWKYFGRGKREGTVVYVGAEGVDKIGYSKGQTARVTVRYDAVISVGRSNTRTRRASSAYTHCMESVSVSAGGTSTVLLFGFYYSSGQPGDGEGKPEVICVREVGRRAIEHLYEATRGRLARGEAVTFNITGGPSQGAVVLQGDQVDIHSAAQSPSLRQRFHRSQVSARFQQGFVEIVPRDPGVAGMSIDGDHLQNADILVLLLGR